MTTTNEHRKGYKKTKLGWIPEEWDIIKFSGLLQKENSLAYGVLQPGKNVKNGVPMIRTVDLIDSGIKDVSKIIQIPKELDEQYKRTRLRGGEVIISVMGTLGRTIVVPQEWAGWNVNRALSVAHINGKINKVFLVQIIRSPQFEKRIIEEALGSAQKRINLSDLKTYKFSLPPLPEQQKIAAILSTWDESVKLTKKLIQKKELQKKALTQQLLTGKKRLKGFEKKSEKQKTKFGCYPIDWQYIQIDDIATNFSEKNRDGENLPVLSCTKHHGLVDSLKYFDRRVYSEDTSTYKVVNKGQFAYATNHIEEGSIGYQNLYEKALISPMYTAFQTSEKVYDRFLFYLLKTDLYIHIYQINTSASVDRRGSLRWNHFRKIRVPLPSIKEQKAIVSILNKANEEITELKSQLINLQNQKKGLMQQLLTGKKRVKL